MHDEHLHILLIEDDPGDAAYLQEILPTEERVRLDLTWVDRLQAGLERLSENDVDVVLLDLGLPDSDGLETLEKVYAYAPNVPVVVLTGDTDQERGVHAMKQGAEDYLVKSQVDRPLLIRTLRYAVERMRLRDALHEARQREQHARELLGLERSFGTTTTVTAQALGIAPLRLSTPDTFLEFVQSYGVLMDKRLEERTYKVEHDIAGGLRVLARRLGRLKAGPRDVIELHTTTLKNKDENAPLLRAQAYAREGHLMILELMGYLVSFYRNHVPGAPRSTEPDIQQR